MGQDLQFSLLSRLVGLVTSRRHRMLHASSLNNTPRLDAVMLVRSCWQLKNIADRIRVQYTTLARSGSGRNFEIQRNGLRE